MVSSKTKVPHTFQDSFSGLMYESANNSKSYHYSKHTKKHKFKPTVNIGEAQANYYQNKEIVNKINEHKKTRQVGITNNQTVNEKIIKNLPTEDKAQSPLVVLHQRGRQPFQKSREQIVINTQQTMGETKIYQADVSNKKALDWSRLLSFVRKSDNVESLIKNMPKQECSNNQTIPNIDQRCSKEKIKKKRVVCNSLDKNYDKRLKKTSYNHIKVLNRVPSLENNLVGRIKNAAVDPKEMIFVDSRHAAKFAKHFNTKYLDKGFKNNILKKEMNVTLSALNILMNSKPNAIKPLYKPELHRKKPKSTVSSKRKIRRIKRKLPTVHEEKVIKVGVTDIIRDDAVNCGAKSKADKGSKYSAPVKESNIASNTLPKHGLKHKTNPKREAQKLGSLLQKKESTVKDLPDKLSSKTNKWSTVFPSNEGPDSFIIIPDNSISNNARPVFLKKKIKLKDLQGVEGYVVKNFFSNNDISKLNVNKPESTDVKLSVDKNNDERKHENNTRDRTREIKIGQITSKSPFQSNGVDQVLLYYANKESCSTSKESLKIAIRRDVETSEKGSSNVLNVVIKQTKNSRSNIETFCENDNYDHDTSDNKLLNNNEALSKNHDDEETRGVSSGCVSTSLENKTHNTTDSFSSAVTSNQSTQCTDNFCGLNYDISSLDLAKATNSQEIGRNSLKFTDKSVTEIKDNVVNKNSLRNNYYAQSSNAISNLKHKEICRDPNKHDSTNKEQSISKIKHNDTDCSTSLGKTTTHYNTVNNSEQKYTNKSIENNEEKVSKIKDPLLKQGPQGIKQPQKAVSKTLIYKESEINILQQKLKRIGLLQKKSFVKLLDSKSNLCPVFSKNIPDLSNSKQKNNLGEPQEQNGEYVKKVEIKIMKSPSLILAERLVGKMGTKKYTNGDFLKGPSCVPNSLIQGNDSSVGQMGYIFEDMCLKKSQFVTVLNTDEVVKKLDKEKMLDDKVTTEDTDKNVETKQTIPTVNDVAIQTDPIVSLNQQNSEKMLGKNSNSFKSSIDKKSNWLNLEDYIIGKKQSFIHVINEEPMEGCQNKSEDGLNGNSVEPKNAKNDSVVQNDNNQKVFDKINAISNFLQYLNQTLDGGLFTKAEDHNLSSSLGQFNQTLKSLSENCIEIVGKITNDRSLSQPLKSNILPPGTISEEPFLTSNEKTTKFVNVVSQKREEEWMKNDPSHVEYINIREVNRGNNEMFKSNEGDTNFMFLQRHRNPFFVVVPSDENINDCLESGCQNTVSPSEHDDFLKQIKHLQPDKLNLEDEMENMLLKKKIMKDFGKGDFRDCAKEKRIGSVKRKSYKNTENNHESVNFIMNRKSILNQTEECTCGYFRSENPQYISKHKKSTNNSTQSVIIDKKQSVEKGNFLKHMFKNSPKSVHSNYKTDFTDTNECRCRTGRKGHNEKVRETHLKSKLNNPSIIVKSCKSEKYLIPDNLIKSHKQDSCNNSLRQEGNSITKNKCQSVLPAPIICDPLEKSKGSVSRNRIHSCITISENNNKPNVRTERGKETSFVGFKNYDVKNIPMLNPIKGYNELTCKKPQISIKQKSVNKPKSSKYSILNIGWPWKNNLSKFCDSSSSGSSSNTSVDSNCSQENLTNTSIRHGLFLDKENKNTITIKPARSLTNVFATLSSTTMEKDLISRAEIEDNCLGKKRTVQLSPTIKNNNSKTSTLPNYFVRGKDDSDLFEDRRSNCMNSSENTNVHFKERNYDLEINDSELSLDSSFSNQKRTLVFTNRLIPALQKSEEDMKVFESFDLKKCIDKNSGEDMLNKQNELSDANGWISLSNCELHKSSESKACNQQLNENKVRLQMDIKVNDVMHVVLLPTS